MNRVLLAGLLMSVAACSAQQQSVVLGACKIDGVAQPVLVNAAPLIAGAAGASTPVVASVVALDTALVHPLVTSACDAVARAFAAQAAPVAAVTAGVPAR